MSRTYRRKKNNKSRVHTFHYAVFFPKMANCKEWYWYYNELFTHYPTKRERKRAKARFHSDKTYSFKEPGPSWFRNLFAQRPYRRESKNELRKVVQDKNYDPVIENKPKVPYWT